MQEDFLSNVFLLLVYISLFIFVCGVIGLGQLAVGRWLRDDDDDHSFVEGCRVLEVCIGDFDLAGNCFVEALDDAVPGIDDLEERL